MGADYISATCVLPHDRHNIELSGFLCEEFKSIIKLSISEKFYNSVIAGDTVAEYSVYDFFQDAESYDDLINQLVGLYGEITVYYTRDIDNITDQQGRPCLITGGLSWGDSPTNSFDTIALFDALELFNKPLKMLEDETWTIDPVVPVKITLDVTGFTEDEIAQIENLHQAFTKRVVNENRLD